MPRLDYDPHDPDWLKRLPEARAVYTLRLHGGEPLLGQTANLRRRLERYLAPAAETADAPPRQLDLRAQATALEYQLAGSGWEAQWLLYQNLRREFPGDYRRRLRLRRPVYLKLTLDNEFPRLTLTRKIPRSAARVQPLLFGPLPSPAGARRLAEAWLDEIHLRRCQPDLNPDADFPGCVFSEVKLCPAPCNFGCSREDYAGLVRRMRENFASRGASLLEHLIREREACSQDCDFERAAAIHQRWQRLQTLHRRLPAIAATAAARAVLLLPGPADQPRSGQIFLWQNAALRGPSCLDAAAEPQTVLAALSALESLPMPAFAQRADHAALLLRWMRRARRVGDWLDWPIEETAPPARLMACLRRRAAATGKARHAAESESDLK